MKELQDQLKTSEPNPETLDQIVRRILKLHNEKPLSQSIDELKNEIYQLSDHDDEYLRDIPKGKTKITNEYLESMTTKDKKEFLIKSEQKNLKTLAKIKEKLKTSMKIDK